MPGGQHGFVFILFGILGATVIFGIPWLIGAILPFVGSPTLGSPTGWILCLVGFGAGNIVAQIGIQGWSEAWRSWVTYAAIVIPVLGLAAIAGLYIQANPDSALLTKGTEIAKRVPTKVWIAIPLSIVVLIFVIPILSILIASAIPSRKKRNGGTSGSESKK